MAKLQQLIVMSFIIWKWGQQCFSHRLVLMIKYIFLDTAFGRLESGNSIFSIATLNILYCINNLWLNNVSRKSSNFLVLDTVKIDLPVNSLYQNFTQVLLQTPGICWSEAWPVAWSLAAVGVGIGGCRVWSLSISFVHFSPQRNTSSPGLEKEEGKKYTYNLFLHH